MKKPNSVETLNNFGRVRLSKNFFMRDFLFSDIASIHGFNNVPDNPDLAIAAGSQLCQVLLEPLQEKFGRISIRSAFRSEEVNGFGSKMMLEGKSGYSCASNEKNYANHIWDKRDKNGHMGATACIIVPSFWDAYKGDKEGWVRLAYWIHDNLNYSSLQFYPKYWAFNINWCEMPERRIDSFIEPRGCLTKPGMPNHEGSHEAFWRDIVERSSASKMDVETGLGEV